jgi:DNA-binding PadR family transcriptional regulator
VARLTPPPRPGYRERVARPADAPLRLADFACLAAVAEGAEHGWAVGSLLARNGEIGRVWSLSRPLTYRSIELLAERRLIARRGTTQGRGGERTLLRITAAGRRALTDWLGTPIEHLRDVRTELLLKLVLRERAGLPNRPLLASQREHFARAIDALTSDRGDIDVVRRWRMESARAVARFLDGTLGDLP